MRLFFYIALILTISSCKIFDGTLKSKSIAKSYDIPDYDQDGVLDQPDKWPDTDGDGISDDVDYCPNIQGTIQEHGCPTKNIEIAMSSMVSYDVPDQFIHSLDEIENKELRDYFIELGFSVQDINTEILNKMSNRGKISNEEYSRLLLQIQKMEAPNLSSNSKPTWIPDVENMDIIDKTIEDTTSSNGTIAYSVPNNMIVGKTYPIKVRITKQKGNEAKQLLIIGDRQIPINDATIDSKITVENIRVEKTMTAQLLSEDGAFEISTMNTDNQIIEDEGYTEWSWVVVPLKSGNNYLKMIIKIKVISEKETHYKDIVVFDKNIQVKSNLSLGVKSWISQYWQWLMTTIIIPLFIFFYKKMSKKE